MVALVPEHRDYQRIIWRFSTDDPIQDYRLTTITYGLNCSPFLAIRTLLQLANTDGSDFPLAAKALLEDTYMDDIVTGVSTVSEAQRLKIELIVLLEKGGFELRKWASNEPSLLSHFPSSHLPSNPLQFEDDNIANASLKLLGLLWHPSSDTFQFNVQPMSVECTKRSMLSNLAKIFDPLGFLSPVTFLLKHLIHKLWSIKLDWDQNPPSDIVRLWKEYQTELPTLNNFSLPRLLVPKTFSLCELHGFGDSSERGYGAVVYLVFTLYSGKRISFFVCSKSRVAPLKKISIPRMELCAAVLLTRLIKFVLEVYKTKLAVSKIYAWSDSTVALSWIKSPSHRWKTFVANRVSFIQECLSPDCWSFVPSSSNPADAVSRGLLPNEFLEHSLWWAGPSFLQTGHFPSLTELSVSPAVLEEQCMKTLTVTILNRNFDELLERYSFLGSVLHIVGYVIRFIYNTRTPFSKKAGSLHSSESTSTSTSSYDGIG